MEGVCMEGVCKEDLPRKTLYGRGRGGFCKHVLMVWTFVVLIDCMYLEWILSI